MAGSVPRTLRSQRREQIVNLPWRRIYDRFGLIVLIAGFAVCDVGQAEDAHLKLPSVAGAVLEPADVPPLAPEPWAVEPPEVDDVISDEELQRWIDLAVEKRLAGIPRPRYIPATDFVPPRGLNLYADPQGRVPFALSLGGFMQLRWLEFARSATEWTETNGRVLPVNNINTFNINRFLISLNGYLLDERLFYNFAFFGTSNLGVRAGVVPIGMAGWKFSDAAAIGVGVTLIPGTREWIEQSPWTIGVDRSMANTFFRSGFSPGAQVDGRLLDGDLHYRAGVWNAIDGGTAGVLRKGTSMAFAGNTWWEPFGPWGIGASDMEQVEDGRIRLGCSGVYAETYSTIVPGINPEDTIIRLSDGTPIAAPGALGPGSEIDKYRFQLATVDAGWKRNGWAVNFEDYFRMLDGFVGSGTFERSSIFDQGGMAYLSWCFIPRTLEIYGRSSAVTGPYGTGQEYGGGWNWYLRESRQARLTIEALHMNRNPAQNLLYPYRAGFTGTAIQTQFVMAW